MSEYHCVKDIAVASFKKIARRDSHALCAWVASVELAKHCAAQVRLQRMRAYMDRQEWEARQNALARAKASSRECISSWCWGALFGLSLGVLLAGLLR